jgi:hypothetical protein
MSAKRYALINEQNLVVNLIVGDLSFDQEQQILASERLVTGASRIIAVEDGISVWIGGEYTDGVFNPPAPEPAPEIVDGTFEVLTEPQPEIEI